MRKTKTGTRLLAIIMALVVALGLFPVAAAAAETGGAVRVCIDFEGYNLGQGFYIEPTVLQLPAGSTVSQAMDALLKQKGYGYKSGGTLVGDAFYLQSVNFPQSGGKITLPTYITDWDYYEGLIEDEIGEVSETGWLGEFDHSFASGWMYTVNHAKADIGAGAYALGDGDVIRWQFTLACGLDLGFDDIGPGGFGPAMYRHADKSELIRALCADGADASAKSAALSVVINPTATAAEVAAATGALKTTTPPTTPDPDEYWFEVALSGNATATLAMNGIRNLLASDFAQTADSYDYSVVKKLRLTGNITPLASVPFDNSETRNALAATLVEVDMGGLTASNLPRFGGASGSGTPAYAALKRVVTPRVNGTSFTYTNVFNGCTSLESIVFNPLSNGGYGSGNWGSGTMFDGCKSLKEITFPGATAPTGFNGSAWSGSNNSTASARAVVAYVPDPASGGYQNATFTNQFLEVRQIPQLADFAALTALIAEAGSYANPSAYTPGTWAAFQSALNAAKAITGANTPAQIDAAYNMLDAAIKGLAPATNTVTYISVPKGATVGVYRKDTGGSMHFKPFTSYGMMLNGTMSDATRDVYNADIPLNTDLHIEAYIKGETAKTAKFIRVASHGTTIAVDPTPLASWTPAANGWQNANLYTNLGDAGTLNLAVGETFALDTFRVWQAMAGYTDNYFIEPEFAFEQYGDSVSLDRIGAPGRERLKITADGPGVSVVKITYDPLEYIRSNGETLRFNAIDPRNTGIVVVNVGGGADFNTGIAARNDFDTYYFDKTVGYREFAFTPAAGSSVRVHDPLNISAYGSGWKDYAADADGSFAVKLRDGRNIIMVQNGGSVRFHVVKARGIDVAVTNKTRPGQPLDAGDTAVIALVGLEPPIEKLAGIYNPGFGTLAPSIRYTDGTASVDSARRGQYSTLTDTFTVEYALASADTVRLNGQIRVGLMGDELGSHRSIPVTGISANMSASARGPWGFGALPEIVLLPAKEPEPVPDDPATISFWAKIDDKGFELVDVGMTVAPDLSERYGFADAYNGIKVTALDALVAAHIEAYGETNVAGKLAASGGWLTKAFGKDASSSLFFVNGSTPGDGVYTPDAYMGGTSQTGYAITEALLLDGDEMMFFLLLDDWGMDYITWFEADGVKINTLDATAGECFDLALVGYMSWYSNSDPGTRTKRTEPFEDAVVVAVAMDGNKGVFGGALGVTDEDGEVSLKFNAAGTYIISAYASEDAILPIIPPWLIVNVREAVGLPTVDYQPAMDRALTYVLLQASNPGVASIGGEWAILARARAGRDDAAWNAIYLENMRAAIAGAYSTANGEVVLERNKPTENERVILALTALGYDASSFEGYDFVAALADMAWVSRQGVNSVIYAILALNSKPYDGVDAQPLVSALTDAQHGDGGWGLLPVSDVDLTAMAIQALAPYYGVSAAAEAAVDKALAWLKSQTIADAEGNAQIIVALSALGLDAADCDGINYVAALLAYCDEPSGGFKRGAAVNMMATEQAAYALVAYDRYVTGKTPLYDMSDVETTVTPPIGDADAEAVDKAAAALTWSIIKGGNAAQDDVRSGLNLPTIGEDGVAIIWGSSEPAYIANDGNVTRPSYAEGSKTVTLTATLTKGAQSKDAIFMLIVTCYDPPSIVKSYAKISVTDPGATGSQTKTYFAEQQFELREGETAFSLLQRTGLAIKTATYSQYAGAYVEAIDGFGEFDDGPLSGWMYKVNGEFPDYSASLYELRNGDVVEWVYTRNLGNDLGGGQGPWNGNNNQTPPGGAGGAGASSGGGGSAGGGESATAVFPGLVDILDSDAPLSDFTNWANPFADVVTGDWYYGAVAFAHKCGLMVGTGSDAFAPGSNLSRAMIVTILWRLEGSPGGSGQVADGDASDALTLDASGASSDPHASDAASDHRAPDTSNVQHSTLGARHFSDVAADAWYSDAIAWAATNSIVLGYSDGTFGPNDDITREQLATILHRYHKWLVADGRLAEDGGDHPAASGGTPPREGKGISLFVDAGDIGEWALEAMIWANAEGLITGRSPTAITPQGTATRAEAATIIQRFVERFA